MRDKGFKADAVLGARRSAGSRFSGRHGVAGSEGEPLRCDRHDQVIVRAVLQRLDRFGDRAGGAYQDDRHRRPHPPGCLQEVRSDGSAGSGTRNDQVKSAPDMRARPGGRRSRSDGKSVLSQHMGQRGTPAGVFSRDQYCF